MRNRTITLVAFAAFAACGGGITVPSAHAGEGWCRLDDPGTTEQIRRERKLANDKLDQIACPTKLDVTKLPDELWLPMPCNHFIGLRKIQIGVKNLLDQKEIYLGDAEAGEAKSGAEGGRARQQALSGPWRSTLSGSLGRPNAPTARAYYIGKYEVTEIQYTIFRHGLLEPGAESKPGACAIIDDAAKNITGTRVVPATGMSWYQAAAFADALTRYLIELDRPRIEKARSPMAIPWVEATPSYLRLPTEVEWEYAARGGEATPATQQQKVYMVAGDNGAVVQPAIEDIAAINTPENRPADGHKVQAAGRKKPNLFGLYDMLGNADEMTTDLFHPVHPTGILAALQGGVVVRGGNATDPAEAIGVGLRREMPLYRRDGAAISEVTGFRLVLAGPIFVNKGNDKFEEMVGNPELDRALGDAQKYQVTPAGSGEAERQRVTEQLSALKRDNEKRSLDSAALAARLDALKSEVDRANAAVNERDRRNRQQMVENQVGLAVGYNNLYRRVKLGPTLIQPLRDRAQNAVVGSPEREKALHLVEQSEADLARLEGTQREALRLYIDGIAAIARDGGAAAEEALTVVQEAEKDRIDKDYQRGLRVVAAHLRQFMGSGNAISQAKTNDWKADLEQRFIEQK